MRPQKPHDWPARDRCCWIDGDPRNGGTFCGEPTVNGGAWCDVHRERCYLPADQVEREVARMRLMARNKGAGRECAHLIPAF